LLIFLESISDITFISIEGKVKWDELLAERDLKKIMQIHKRNGNDDTSESFEMRFVNKDGNIRDVIFVVDAIPNTERTVVSIIDITEQKMAQRVLVESNEKLQEMDKLKTNFLSTVSHELRTPLTSILGFAKIIKKRLSVIIPDNLEAFDKKYQKTSAQIYENVDITSEGERLTELINDVLDIAKMEAGKVEWKMKENSVSEILERALKSTAALYEQKGIQVSVSKDEKVPAVICDFDRIMQVIINLISNAVKFTDEGSITCRIRNAIDELVVSITDTGVGISQEDIESVFDRFKQAGDTLTNRPQGTGLGLAICKQIVEYHGGRIWVISEKEKGSNFSFTLPLNSEKQSTM
jgi:signal transduction histidine kinase